MIGTIINFGQYQHLIDPKKKVSDVYEFVQFNLVAWDELIIFVAEYRFTVHPKITINYDLSHQFVIESVEIHPLFDTPVVTIKQA